MVPYCKTRRISAAALSSANAAKPTILPDKAGTYTLSLVVNDGTDDSAADTVTITVTLGNTKPIANAGADQTVGLGATVQLDGSASSDADGDTLTYAWSLTAKPEGSEAALSSATIAKPTILPDTVGTYTISLVVNDGTENSDADTVTLTVSYMGTAYEGHSIPFNTTYGFEDASTGYSTSVRFADATAYDWDQARDGQAMPTMEISCTYDTVSGAFSNQMTGQYGQEAAYPVSFTINNGQRLYLFTYDLELDADLLVPRFIIEKTSGVAGTMVGVYISSFEQHNWIDDEDGRADIWYEFMVNHTYGTDGSLAISGYSKLTVDSDIELPDYGIPITDGPQEYIENRAYTGTWAYNTEGSTITETITDTEDAASTATYTYTPYWVSYNGKDYLVTSLTRYYEKIVE